MRVVVLGGSGNVGTSLLTALAGDDDVTSVVGLARRRPEMVLPKLTWLAADIRTADLDSIFRGADAVVHLAWIIQPSHDQAELESVNVGGTRRVLEAIHTAGVATFIYASSVGAYSPGPKDRPVDESWPTDGVASSFYSRHKAIVERMLDRFESEHPDVRVVRLRKGLIFKRESASGIRRLFLGPLVPGAVLHPSRIPVVPRTDGLRFQAVHADDVAEAYRLAILRAEARGAYNVAADPVLDPDSLARIIGARAVPLPRAVLRLGFHATWVVGAQPTPPGWIDLALQAPVMSTDRARKELGWVPRRTAADALLELLEGMHDGAGIKTPPLAPWGNRQSRRAA